MSSLVKTALAVCTHHWKLSGWGIKCTTNGATLPLAALGALFIQGRSAVYILARGSWCCVRMHRYKHQMELAK